MLSNQKKLMAHHYSEHHATNHHHHVESQAQPSSISSSPTKQGSSSSPPPSSTTSPSNKALLNARQYQMLMVDNVDGLQELGCSLEDLCEVVCESDNSTILHITASAGQLEHIKLIVKQSQHLLYRPNSNDDLPIHVAARTGQQDAVEKLVELASSEQHNNDGVILMLGRENKDKNTALHVALENQQKVMSRYLFDKCPQTFYHLNAQGICPLYLAIKASFWDLVESMLQPQVAHDAEAQLLRDQGKSVVHAAIMARNKEILKKMLEEYHDLITRTDEKGRRPLSYAAYIGFLDGVKHILSMRNLRNQAFKADEDGSFDFPIHKACRGGNVLVVKEFFSPLLPKKMRWLLNKKGQSILHVAARSGKTEVVKYLLAHSDLETMINMKDEDGNTPLHLATLGKHPKVAYLLTWDKRVKLSLQNKEGSTALDIAEDNGEVPSFEERLTWLALKYAGVPSAPQLQVHLQNSMPTIDQVMMNSPGGVALHDNYIPATLSITDQGNPAQHYLRTFNQNKYKDRVNPLLIASTLVATVTFASGFTVPGGYNNSGPNEGMATLAHKCAFQVFMISIIIAMNSSVLAVVALIWAHLDDLRLILLSLHFAMPLLGIALTMMSVAFMAGLYVVLHDLFWLGIVVLIMGGMFLCALLVFFVPLYSPMSCIKNRILRYFFHIPFTLMLLACKQGHKGVTLY